MSIILLFLLSFVMLYLGGEFLVKSAVAISSKMKISTLVVGMTIVSFATSSPELFVSIQSAFRGATDITFGNIIGSNISNITLVLGLTSIVFSIKISIDTLRINYPFMMLSSLLFGLMLYIDQGIDRFTGILFIFILFIFSLILIRRSRRKIDLLEKEELKYNYQKELTLFTSIVYMILSVILLAFGSDFLVDSVKGLSQKFSVEERIISVTLVAIGTSIPELATSLVAAFRKEANLAIGNLVGSNIFNILAVLGITSIIQPISLSEETKDIMNNPLIIDYMWMMGCTFLLGIFMYVFSRRVLTKIEGVLLLTSYILFLYFLF